jgi:hypothetical protein
VKLIEELSSIGKNPDALEMNKIYPETDEDMSKLI